MLDHVVIPGVEGLIFVLDLSAIALQVLDNGWFVRHSFVDKGITLSERGLSWSRKMSICVRISLNRSPIVSRSLLLLRALRINQKVKQTR